MDQAGIGEDFAQVERFTPAGVGDDHVRDEAALAQAVQRAGDGLAVEDGAFHLAQIGVLRLARRAMQAVLVPAHAGHAGGGLAPQADDFAVRALRPCAGNVAELTGEVLMKEEDAHGWHVSPERNRNICGTYDNSIHIIR